MRLAVALVLALVSVPSALAVWHPPGGFEPDTAYDAGQMWSEPGPATDDPYGHVYFDGFSTAEPLVVNPNVGLLGSRFAAPVQRYHAFLGAWKDCNQDGYIGLAEGAVQEYRAELANASVCPVGGEHNDGFWVHEIVQIGAVDPCQFRSVQYQEANCRGVGSFTKNPYVIYSNGSAVWADLGTPGAAPDASCPVGAQPRGTTSSTGGLIAAFECRTGSTPLDTAPDLVLPVSTFGDGTRAGLLQQDSGEPAFSAWDCSQGTSVADPTGQGALSAQDPSGGSLSGPQDTPLGRQTVFHNDADPSGAGTLTVRYADAQSGEVAFVPAPDVASLTSPDARGSAWDAAVQTADGVRLGASENPPVVQKTTPGGPILVVAENGDCDARTYDTLEQAYVGDQVESSSAAFTTSDRARSDVVMTFYGGYRGWDEHIDDITQTRSAPTDVGLLWTRSLHQGPLWSAMSSTVSDPTPLRRDTLQPEGAKYVTFYAQLGAEASTIGLQLPPGAGGVYGSEPCGAATSGHQNAWDCDATHWWDAGASMPRFAEGAPIARSVGAAYDLRDVDCVDGAVARGLGVDASTAQISPDGPCDEG